MSAFGGPGGGLATQKPIPFPLDHEGECKKVMMDYLGCIKKVKGMNDNECRNIAKSYLSCRMDRNLMARDEFKNLGFKDDTETKEVEKRPGELRW
ncbi:cytochrome c oxidase assembly protein [Grosmannia clavigera kw1407]|uniref:Cytochrome c oxidase assembly protein n=1 Tax=Grosmannia clavigera (strain kw1407 / UAMH 11150) TaxID=655863 RepID=F0X9B3_GROCL|nr:cytochrome c oxidase assembly protein [Grosmannia clavigera kw1407]EFX05767.1 cytochrome c oxidase assembly protein [Grosmannia clavigera kw1407]